MKTLNDRFDINEAADLLKEYKEEIKFPTLKPPQDIEFILDNLGSNEYIKSLCREDISSLMVSLSLYSLFLTSQEARLKTYVNFCESNIKFIVGENMNSMQGYFNEKDLAIRATNDLAKDYEAKKLSAHLKLDSIMFISQKLEKLGDVLKTLYFEKKKAYDSNYKI